MQQHKPQHHTTNDHNTSPYQPHNQVGHQEGEEEQRQGNACYPPDDQEAHGEVGQDNYCFLIADAKVTYIFLRLYLDS